MSNIEPGNRVWHRDGAEGTCIGRPNLSHREVMWSNGTKQVVHVSMLRRAVPVAIEGSDAIDRLNKTAEYLGKVRSSSTEVLQVCTDILFIIRGS